MNDVFEIGGDHGRWDKNRVVGRVDHKRPSPLGVKAVEYNADALAHGFMLLFLMSSIRLAASYAAGVVALRHRLSQSVPIVPKMRRTFAHTRNRRLKRAVKGKLHVAYKSRFTMNRSTRPNESYHLGHIRNRYAATTSHLTVRVWSNFKAD
jgi:hypothetical protein